MNPCPVALPAAKLDPPTLQSIRSMPPQTDCVTLTWTMTPRNAHMELRCELRYRAPEDPSWGVVSAEGAEPVPHLCSRFPALVPVPWGCAMGPDTEHSRGSPHFLCPAGER